MLTGRCRPWIDEQLDTAAVLALVYGKVGYQLTGCNMNSD